MHTQHNYLLQLQFKHNIRHIRATAEDFFNKNWRTHNRMQLLRNIILPIKIVDIIKYKLFVPTVVSSNFHFKSKIIKNEECRNLIDQVKRYIVSRRLKK